MRCLELLKDETYQNPNIRAFETTWLVNWVWMLQKPLRLIKLPNVVVQFNIHTTPTFHFLMLPTQGHSTNRSCQPLVVSIQTSHDSCVERSFKPTPSSTLSFHHIPRLVVDQYWFPTFFNIWPPLFLPLLMLHAIPFFQVSNCHGILPLKLSSIGHSCIAPIDFFSLILDIRISNLNNLKILTFCEAFDEI